MQLAKQFCTQRSVVTLLVSFTALTKVKHTRDRKDSLFCLSSLLVVKQFSIAYLAEVQEFDFDTCIDCITYQSLSFQKNHFFFSSIPP